MRQDNWKVKITLFLISQTISMLGSSLVMFAIIWYITKTTNSGVMVAISTACSFVPSIFVSIFAGVWADRYNRKHLILAADLLIATATLVLALFFMAGHTYLWLVFLISAIRSMGGAVQGPAVNALIPQIVPEDKLMRVNGINGTIQSLVNLVAPAVGGAVLTFGEIYYVMLIDVVTAAIGISVLLMLKISTHEKAASAQTTGYLADLKEGLQYSLKNFFVRKLLGFYAVYTIVIVPIAFLNVLFVTRVFGDSYVYLTMNEMAFFIGTLLGGVLIATWGGFRNRMATLILGCLLSGMLGVVIAMMKVFWIYLILMFLIGCTMPLCNAPVMVMIQEKVDNNMLGRVFSLMSITFSTMMLIGISVFGPLADVVKLEYLIIGTGVLQLLLVLGVWRDKPFMEEGLPVISKAAEEEL